MKNNRLNELNYVQREKVSVYYELLKVVHPFYKKQDDEIRKSFITTLFGAGLFYLPHGVKYWVGKISVSCLMEQIIGTKNARKVKDHIYPRKAAADHLLSTLPKKEEFVDFFVEKIVPYMYVTPNENSRLINYYQEFDRYQDALEYFDIQEFPTNGQVFESTKELNSFIQFCRVRYHGDSKHVIQHLQDWYIEFKGL